MNAETLKEEISSRKVNKMWFTSGWFNQLVETDLSVFNGLDVILVGGEKLSERHIEKMRVTNPHIKLINGYGPTENTTFSLTYNINENEIKGSVPIGHPLSNRSALILDEAGQIVPVGVGGEICLGGAGLGRGYLNREELTAEKFISNQYSNEEGAKLYLTGDIGRWLPDGNIEYLGRKDSQVKIRGYRIEPGEIENVLQQNKSIKQAVVLARELTHGNRTLVGYVVPEDSFDKDDILLWLRERLPEYMIPDIWIELEKLPLTFNGKVNYKALPDPDVTKLLKDNYAAPRNATEEAIVGIWKEILEIEQVGIHDDFFELGGHSLLAIRVVSAIRKQLNAEIPINSVFENSTVAEISHHIQSKSQTPGFSSIERLNPRPGHIPLSFSQERLWFTDRLEGSVQYHVATVLRLKGKISFEALEYALKTVVTRHEVLRTIFLEDQVGKPYQFVRDAGDWSVKMTDKKAYSEDKEVLQKYIQGIIRQPFDLSKDYLVRAELIVAGTEKYVLVVTFHHIVSDGWSRSILVKEVVELYSAYEQGYKLDLQPLGVQYADFSIWQRNYLQGDLLEKKLKYWKDKLEGTAVLELPTDNIRNKERSNKGSLADFNLDKNLTTRLQELSQSQGATLFMTLMAAFKVLLYRYSGQEDICVGTAVAGRHRQELEGLIGFFLNTLALRDVISSDNTFTELLQKVKITTLGGFEHQELPFEKVVEAVVKERDAHRSPLFQVMLVLQNTPDIPELRFGEIILSREESYSHSTSLFDITFYITETSAGLNLSVEYSTSLYHQDTIERMFGHYKQLLLSIVENPEQKIGVLSIFTKAEENRLLFEFNDTKVDYEKNKTVADLFEDQVFKTPEALAILSEEKQITFKELNEKANNIANFLQKKGVQEGVLVAICIERSIELVAGIMGILKAGGGYIPIDAEYPKERIFYMLKDTGVKILITTSKLSDLFVERGIEVILSDQLVNIGLLCDNPKRAFITDAVVCVIYTSGSSGYPKGVVLSNTGIVNRLYWMWNTYPFAKDERSAFKTSIGFVDHMWELFGALAGGVTTIIFNNDEVRDISFFIEKLSLQKITRLVLVPSLLRAVLNRLKEEDTRLKDLFWWSSSGEPLSIDLLQDFYKLFPGNHYHLLNIYGSSEVTADVICYDTVLERSQEEEINKIGKVPLGRPIWNCQIYISDLLGNLVPQGVFGEICVGGLQVAEGYLNLTELTRQKFPKNLFGSKSSIYKTGDIGRWMSNGNIEYLGRRDGQIKIRGNRIELQEIENVLQESNLVEKAVVLAKEHGVGDQRLLSYYTPKWSVFKEKERQLYFAQIATWKELYETEYSNPVEEDIDEEFNIDIWNDSFTGKPIGKERMKEWLEDIVNVIMLEQPNHVLEIGCGIGLIYYKLAGKVTKYIGTDFSPTSINKISQHISKGNNNYGTSEFIIGGANEIELKEEEPVDTIILNSIVQYFPGEGYMNDVIAKCVSFIKDKGCIIIGDVRHKDLLELFKGRLQLQKLRESLSIKEFEWIVKQDVLKEEELCFSPDYFYALKIQYPQISHIEIKWKQGSYINELTSYRYTVIISIDKKREILKPSWQNWESSAGYENIFNQLEQGEKIIAIKNVPNPRLSQERLLSKALNSKSANTVGDLLEIIQSEDDEILVIREMLEKITLKGYGYRLLLNEDPLKVNLIIESEVTNNFVEGAYSYKTPNDSGNSLLTNVPLYSDISFLLQKEMRVILQNRLPEYMVPSQFIGISEFPLNNNSKIDRNFLSKREDTKVADNLNYTEPRTKLEHILTKIWQDLLGAERISIYDNFFELGGHSLLATRVISALRKELKIAVSVKILFTYPTIASFAEQLNCISETVILPPSRILSRPGFIPLSFSQERLWFIDRLEGSVQYHMPVVLRLRGRLDKKALHYALLGILNRHESLRTVFSEHQGQVHQWVKESGDWKMQISDEAKHKEDPRGLNDYVDKLIAKPFDLSKDIMFRASLIQVDKEEYLLVVVMHHIASDGWSLSVIVKEVAELYNSYERQLNPQLPALPFQYADFAIWQREYIQGGILEAKINYWKNKLYNLPPLQLSTDYVRPNVQSIRGGSAYFQIEKEIVKQLHEIGAQNGTTLFMTLLSVFKVLLYRYSSQEDICVGTVTAGRQYSELENLVGFFVNTLALRNEVNASMPFTELLQRVKITTIEAYANEEVPFEKVVEVVSKQRDLSRSPLFQVMFVLQNTPEMGVLHLNNLKLSTEAVINVPVKFDLTFNIKETVNGLQGFVEYSADLFHKETIELMISHYRQLLLSVLKDTHQLIGSLSIMNNEEENQLLENLGNAQAGYPLYKNVVNLFEEQVIRTPHNIAVIYLNDIITYNELNEQANQLSYYLLSKGVKGEQLIPICIERGINMIIGILAILKAGAAYVPIDPDYPIERINYILNDTTAQIVVSSKQSSLKLREIKEIEVILIDELSEDYIGLKKDKTVSPSMAINPEHLAYVIYTSGSTGKPKGVLIEHRNIVRLFKTESQLYDFNERDVWTLFHSFCFDFSVWEMYGALLQGAKLIVVSVEATKDIALFADLLIREKVTVLNQTPTAFYGLQDYFISKIKSNSLRYVIFGGEALNPTKLQPWKLLYKDCRLINMYGITETTVHVTYKEIGWEEIQKSNSIIGKPIPTLSAFILDDEQQLVPVGVPGELFIGGAGVARGYLNRENLTKERFLKKQFGNAGVRLYRTGDLGRWLRDGSIEYLGRKDEQVKIRGFRIEPGEIESELQQSGFIKQAIVLAREDEQGNRALIGYVVPNGKFRKGEVLSYLQKKLPNYMIPAIWVEIESLPLTSNGKIDKKALPNPNVTGEILDNKYASPRNELETALCKIWQDLLRIDRVGIEDNFFELGGDSIMTIQLISRIRPLNFELQPKDIFLNQTIARLSESLSSRLNVLEKGEQGLLTGECGLLPVQKWYLENQDNDLSHFNQSILLNIKKSLTEKVLGKAVKHLIAHHDALRFRYCQQDGKWKQEYGLHYQELIVENIQSQGDTNINQSINEIASKHQKSLDIEKGELVRVVLFRLNSILQDKLLVIVHHLAIDGVSWRTLIEDLQLLLDSYNREQKIELGNKATSYRQWYEALESYGKSNELLSQREYWTKSLLKGSELLLDKQYNDQLLLNDISNYTIRFNREQTLQLVKEVSGTYNTGINDLLLCALARTLRDWSKSDDVTIGLEGHGREEIEKKLNTGRTVGWFTNLYPVVLEAERGKDYGNWIKSIKEQLRLIPDKGIGYGVLKYINREEALQGGDNWEILFNYLGQVDNIFGNSEWFEMGSESTGPTRSKTHKINEKIAVNCMIRSDELIVNWSYSNKHFETETIKSLAQDYLYNLGEIVSYCLKEQEEGRQSKTPSDYGLVSEIKYNELDGFLNEELNGTSRRELTESLYRLSGLQQGMLFHGLYNENSTAYLEQVSCSLKNVNPEFFIKSWEYILKKHSSLRTAFYYNVFSLPVQVVYNDIKLPVEIVDFSQMSAAEQLLAIQEYENKDLHQGFNFEVPPLMRFGLMRLSDSDYRMLWTSHHLLFDGWSMPILIEEFLIIYEALLAGDSLKNLSQDNYEDYIRFIEGRNKFDEKKYWKSYLDTLEHPTLLPFIKTTNERTKGVGSYKTISLDISNNLAKQLNKYVKKQRITMNTLMQGVWSLLLNFYTGKKDVLFGVVVSGRPDALSNVEKRVGLYINTLPFYARINEEKPVAEWLQDLQDQQVLSRQYQHVSLSDIKNWVNNIQGDLFDTILVFENYPVSELVTSKKWVLEVADVQMKEQSNYPLSVEIASSGKINIRFNYNSQLLEEEYVRQMKDHFNYLLLQIANPQKVALKDIDILCADETSRLLNKSNGIITNYNAGKSISAVFDEQVTKNPDKVSLTYNGHQLTYVKLNAIANKLGNYLRNKGVKEGALVPVCLSRSSDLIIALLGILKAGAAYVTIDPGYPAERINFILQDVSAEVIITNKEHLPKFTVQEGLDIIKIDSDWQVIEEQSEERPSAEVTTRSLAYVIYTSGSTGQPKGVLIEQGNVVSLVKEADYIHLSDIDVLLATGSPSFDASTFEYWSMLLNGGKLVLCDDEQLFSSELLKEEIRKEKVNEMWFTSGWFNQLADTDISVFEGLEAILVGGEKLSERHIEKVQTTYPKLTIINGYGPTENTTFSLTYQIDENKIKGMVPVGRPLGNRSALILNEAGKLVPTGVLGEICVGGAGLGRGYLNQPQLTAEKFIKNPYRSEQGQPERLYHTGDIGRWLPDGNIEYLGRMDDQVKIRGYRVELGEIESVVHQSGLVKQALILAREDKQGIKTLIGYAVTADEMNKELINAYLRNRLPGYMIPDIWIKMSSFPLTTNGKIDRKALISAQTNEAQGKEYVAPRNEVEAGLAKIWQNLLGSVRVGVEDNFFELGGHSLLAMRVMSAIRREFEVEVNVKDIFEFNTIGDLAKYLEIQMNVNTREKKDLEFDILSI